MRHLLALFNMKQERKNKGVPADTHSDFKVSSLPPSLCSFSEEQLDSKFHLHEPFVASHVQMLFSTHVPQEANYTFVYSRITPLVKKEEKG